MLRGIMFSNLTMLSEVRINTVKTQVLRMWGGGDTTCIESPLRRFCWGCYKCTGPQESGVLQKTWLVLISLRVPRLHLYCFALFLWTTMNKLLVTCVESSADDRKCVYVMLLFPICLFLFVWNESKHTNQNEYWSSLSQSVTSGNFHKLLRVAPLHNKSLIFATSLLQFTANRA